MCGPRGFPIATGIEHNATSRKRMMPSLMMGTVTAALSAMALTLAALNLE
jgi:hypothetical protein